MNKFLIVGLGNIGAEYAATRHNIGFLAVEHLAQRAALTFADDRYGAIAQYRLKGKQLTLLKPSTYMNLSGKAVRYWMQHIGITTEQLFIVVDELNLPFGKLRAKPSGSDGGHNGLKSINELLATNQYPRLRVGIGNDFERGKQSDYVLGTWSAEEKSQLPEVLGRCADAICNFALSGLTDTMNRYNA